MPFDDEKYYCRGYSVVYVHDGWHKSPVLRELLYSHSLSLNIVTPLFLVAENVPSTGIDEI